MTMLDPVEYVAMIAVARRRDLRSCSTFLAAHESVVPFVRKDSASSHKPIGGFLRSMQQSLVLRPSVPIPPGHPWPPGGHPLAGTLRSAEALSGISGGSSWVQAAQLGDALCGLVELQALAGPVVELVGDLVQVAFGDRGEVKPLGEVLA
jgi:hypothetical protein